tara:strand:- start:1682 stop:2347 length:666 start_codon:yes stop_codon:yes gene_type:complete
MKNLNLRSSQFSNYIFGQYTPRKEMLELQLQGKEPKIPRHMMKYVAHGNFNEKMGIAFYVKHFKQIPKDYLKDQQNYIIQNWLNLPKGKETVSISTTPDSISHDETHLIEVKCSMKDKYEEFNKLWLPQVYGQQHILSSLGKKIEKTYLINYTPTVCRIWQIDYNQEFIDYLMKNLSEFAECLLKGKANGLVDKPDRYQGDIDESIKLIKEYHYGDKNGIR